MKLRTCVIAWLWTALLAWSTINLALTTLGIRPYHGSLAHSIGFPVVNVLFLFLTLSGVALILRRGWGWWVLVISLALFVAIGLFDLGWFLVNTLLRAEGPIMDFLGWLGPLAALGVALNGVALWLLLTDPPRRWANPPSPDHS